MTIGEVRRVNLPAFTVIGKEGKGLGARWFIMGTAFMGNCKRKNH